MLRAADIVLIFVILVSIGGLWSYFSKSDKKEYLHEEQLNDAHRILVELQITDDLMNILPAELRSKLHIYMERCGKSK